MMVLFALALTEAAGQGTTRVRERLALPDTLHSSRVVVTERGDAASTIKMLESAVTDDKVYVYRVSILNDSSQEARSVAYSTLDKFRELYPGTFSDIYYVEPSYRVLVGNCLTKEESIILWGRIKGTFPKAVLVSREKVPVSAFIK